jgi:hypothetical protein
MLRAIENANQQITMELAAKNGQLGSVVAEFRAGICALKENPETPRVPFGALIPRPPETAATPAQVVNDPPSVFSEYYHGNGFRGLSSSYVTYFTQAAVPPFVAWAGYGI